MCKNRRMNIRMERNYFVYGANYVYAWYLKKKKKINEKKEKLLVLRASWTLLNVYLIDVRSCVCVWERMNACITYNNTIPRSRILIHIASVYHWEWNISMYTFDSMSTWSRMPKIESLIPTQRWKYILVFLFGLLFLLLLPGNIIWTIYCTAEIWNIDYS